MENIRKSKVKKITFAAMFATLSASISLFLSYLIPTGGSVGLPLYGIPLIMASIILGPSYGVLSAFVADLAIGFLGKYGYMPLYMISTLAWGTIPGLFISDIKKYNLFKVIFVTLYSYFVATLGNSIANYVYWGMKTTMATLPIRGFNMLIFTPVIAWITHLLLTNAVMKNKYLCGIRVRIVYGKKN